MQTTPLAATLPVSTAVLSALAPTVGESGSDDFARLVVAEATADLDEAGNAAEAAKPEPPMLCEGIMLVTGGHFLLQDPRAVTGPGGVDGSQPPADQGLGVVRGVVPDASLYTPPIEREAAAPFATGGQVAGGQAAGGQAADLAHRQPPPPALASAPALAIAPGLAPHLAGQGIATAPALVYEPAAVEPTDPTSPPATLPRLGDSQTTERPGPILKSAGPEDGPQATQTGGSILGSAGPLPASDAAVAPPPSPALGLDRSATDEHVAVAVAASVAASVSASVSGAQPGSDATTDAPKDAGFPVPGLGIWQVLVGNMAARADTAWLPPRPGRSEAAQDPAARAPQVASTWIDARPVLQPFPGEAQENPLGNDTAFAGTAISGLLSSAPGSGPMQGLAPGYLPPGCLPQLAAQIGASLAHHANGTTEFTLSPQELGQVRITLQPESPTSDRIVVMLSFDRPDTLELFRRHADQLATALEAAGFAGSSLGFAQSGGGDSGGDSTGNGRGSMPGSGQIPETGFGRDNGPDQTHAKPTPSPLRVAPGTHDLRL